MVSNLKMMLRAPLHDGARGSTGELEVLIGLGVSASTQYAFDSYPSDLHVVGWGGSCTPIEHIRSNPHVK